MQDRPKQGALTPKYHSLRVYNPIFYRRSFYEKRFKVFYFDVGLAQRMLGLDLKHWVTTPLEVKHVGAIAEQLVAQEYLAYTSIKSYPELYYWHREEKQSNAEVDFLFLKNGLIVPVEVKSGIRGGYKSIRNFLDTHPNSKTALKITENPFNKEKPIRNIPLYGLEGWLKDSS